MAKSREPTRLTEKQKRFCDEYLVDLNATQAVLRAGYKTKHPDKMGSELLGKTRVKEYIEQRMKNREKRTEITQDMVIQELAKIGFSDMGNFLSYSTKISLVGRDKQTGEAIMDYRQVIEMLDSDEVDTSIIQEVSIDEKGVFKFKLYDKQKALVDLGKHLGMFKHDVNITGVVPIVIKDDLDE